MTKTFTNDESRLGGELYKRGVQNPTAPITIADRERSQKPFDRVGCPGEMTGGGSMRSMQPNDQELIHAAGDSRQPETRGANGPA